MMRGVFCISALLTFCSACPSGRFGQNCELKCNCLRNDRDCGNHGCANKRCGYGFTDPPKCQTKCPNGKFGLHCAFSCNCPENDTCDVVNGLCSSNKCREGYGGAGCQKRVPFLSDPPTVNMNLKNQMMILWKPWPQNLQESVSSVLRYTLQITVRDESVSYNVWSDLAHVRGTAESEKEMWIVDPVKPYDVVLAYEDCPHHRVCVLFRNPQFEVEYKYRISISLLRAGRPNIFLEPSPVTPKWHRMPCGEPSASPRSVTVKETNHLGDFALIVEWQPPSSGSINCFSLVRHEVALLCPRDCHETEGGDGIVGQSYVVAWPENILTILNVTDLRKRKNNASSLGVVVRSINDRGFAGPWSDPVHHGFNFSLLDVESRNSESLQTTTTTMTSTPASIRIQIDEALSMRHRPSQRPPYQVPSSKRIQLTLLGRNETHLMAFLEGGKSDRCWAEVQKHRPGNSSPTKDGGSRLKVEVEDSGDHMTVAVTGLEQGAFYRIGASCLGLSERLHLDVAAGFKKPPRPADVEVLRLTSSTVDVLLSLTVNLLNGETAIAIVERADDEIERTFLVIVERADGTGCCQMQHLVESERIAKWDDRIKANTPELRDLLFPNSATSLMYAKSYYVAAEFDSKIAQRDEERAIRSIVDDPGFLKLFTVGDGKTYGRYDNPPLRSNRTYVVWLTVEQVRDGFVRRSFSRSPAVVMPSVVVMERVSAAFTSWAVTVIVATVAISVSMLAAGGFILRWVLQRKKASKLWRRLYNAKLQGQAYLNKEGLQLRRKDVFLEATSPHPPLLLQRQQQLERNHPQPDDRTTAPFTFPTPFTAGLGQEFRFPIPVKDLRGFCDRCVSIVSTSRGSEGCSAAGDFIEKDFGSLPSGFTDVVVASADPSNSRGSTLPYDRNSVKVTRRLDLGQASTDGLNVAEVVHTNASRVRTLGRGSCIVAQTPTYHACCTLWQIVEEAVTHLVDLDSLEERSDVVQQSPLLWSPVPTGYWPQRMGQRRVYGDVAVRLVSEMNLAHYSVRVFFVVRTGQGNKGRFVHQWNYHAWSSRSVPLHHISFLNFVRMLREEVALGRDCTVTEACRALVHCNHGDGRCGVFLAVDSLVVQGQKLSVVDVKGCVALLRSERRDLLKTSLQYAFVHECLAEQFDHSWSTKSVLGFMAGLWSVARTGEKIAAVPSDVVYDHGLMLTCSYMPVKMVGYRPDGFVTSVQSSGERGADWPSLDFVLVDTVRQRKAFLLQKTFFCFDDGRFWNAVIKSEVKTIVILRKSVDLEGIDDPKEQEDDGNGNEKKDDDDGDDDDGCFPLPLAKGVIVGNFMVTCTSVEKLERFDCSTFQLLIVQQKGASLIGRLENYRLKDFWQYKVEVVQVESNWGRSYEESIESMESFLGFVHHLRSDEKWCHPMMITGGFKGPREKKAMDKVGVFAGSWLSIDQALVEGVVDVFGASRFLRSHLPGALSSKEEYHLLCLVVCSYLKSHADFTSTSAQRASCHNRLNSFHWMGDGKTDVRSSLRRIRTAGDRTGDGRLQGRTFFSLTRTASPGRGSSPRDGGICRLGVKMVKKKMMRRRRTMQRTTADLDGSYRKFASPTASPCALWKWESQVEADRKDFICKDPEVKKFGFFGRRRYFDSLRTSGSQSM